jgi:hypothetical protein
VTRFRYDNLENMIKPDRNQFWIKSALPTNTNSKASHLVFPQMRLQQVYLYQEVAAETGSFFVEIPYRQINPNFMPSQAGFADMNFGAKSMFFDSELQLDSDGAPELSGERRADALHGEERAFVARSRRGDALERRVAEHADPVRPEESATDSGADRGYLLTKSQAAIESDSVKADSSKREPRVVVRDDVGSSTQRGRMGSDKTHHHQRCAHEALWDSHTIASGGQSCIAVNHRRDEGSRAVVEFVAIGGNYYSVPDRTRRIVEVQQLPDVIRILDQGHIIAVHPVLEGRRRTRVAPEHRQAFNRSGSRPGAPEALIGRVGDHIPRRSLEFYQAIGNRLAQSEGRS